MACALLHVVSFLSWFYWPLDSQFCTKHETGCCQFLSLSLWLSLAGSLSLSLSLRLSPTILEEVKTLDTFFLFIYLNRRHGSNTDTTRPLPLPAELLIIFTLGSIHQCKSTKNFFLLALFFVFFSQKANLKEKKNR